MTNIAELLKDCPKDTELYTPLGGKCRFSGIDSANTIRVLVGEIPLRFDQYGRNVYVSTHDAECLIFPSKDCRTWEGWKAPKPHYGIKNFKPFDKVLGKNHNNDIWRADYFSHLHKNGKCFVCIGYTWCLCIPYEGNEHLLGTTDMPSEEYINW